MKTKQNKTSTIKDEWYTPKYIVDMFGKFDLDAASNEYNSKRLGIPKYFSKQNSALNKEWIGKVWLNPPFSLSKEFIKKAREEVNKGKCTIYMLINNSVTTKAMHKYILGKATIYIPNSRISFESLDHKNDLRSPRFESIIIKLHKRKKMKYKLLDIKNKKEKNE